MKFHQLVQDAFQHFRRSLEQRGDRVLLEQSGAGVLTRRQAQAELQNNPPQPGRNL